MALSAVVLPAPFGPTSPKMRPSSTLKLTPSSATVVPKVLRRPRASMQTIASALLLFRFGLRPAGSTIIQQFFRGQAQPPNGFTDSGPFFIQKFLTLASQQQSARARLDEHAQAPLLLDQFLVGQFLITLQDRERIEPVFCRHRAHR